MKPEDGKTRVIIEGIDPEIDSGRFPVKRTVGDEVTVEADIYADGHDVISAALLYRKETDSAWTEIPMQPLVNDRWRAAFTVTEMGRYRYTLVGWVDKFKSWRRDLQKKVEANHNVSVELLVGAALLEQASQRAASKEAQTLRDRAGSLRSKRAGNPARIESALSEETLELVDKSPDRSLATTYDKELVVMVDRERARFSTWYEMFPRSCAPEPGRHGTFRDCEARLPYVAEMGFDVLYFPPIHPIGRSNRKGKNNVPRAGHNDPGTPWAIGSEEGGHKAIHPELGTLKDFGRLLKRAREYGIEIALDIAFQCSPDHPYVKDHPEWFLWRPDGSVQYAENPPKKYQDIYPLNFENGDWRGLWEEMKSVFVFWIDQGVRIFRVDNPHTKPFKFWEWLIAEIKDDYPDVILLSEAFTRPKIMYRLAKLGFTQSYTYFAWRNAKWEFAQYLTELTQTEIREFFRPNFWPNTPDILTERLQTGGRPAFMSRLVLAATMAASYGIYGPAFELQEHEPREAGSEEYLNSEKYEIKHWDIESPDSLKGFIAQVNAIRRENPALQSDHSFRFHNVDNEQLICYSKRTGDRSNVILVVVNLEPRYTQSGWVDLSLDELGLPEQKPYEVHDLLSDARYQWRGPRNYVELNPGACPAHIFRVGESRGSQSPTERRGV